MLPDLQTSLSRPARTQLKNLLKPVPGVAAFLTAMLFLLPVRAGAVDIDSETELADGVTFTEGSFTPYDGDVRLFTAVIVKPGSAELQLATPNDDTDNDGGDGKGATLLSMAEDAEKNGCLVLAAINGDFYKTAYDGDEKFPDYAPLGVMVKNGVILSEGQRETGAAFLGVTKEGEPVLGSAEPGGEWDTVKDSLQTAIGGELWLIRDGENCAGSLRWRADTDMLAARYGPAGCVYNDSGERQILTSYPRTAVGLREDGSIVLLTVSAGSVSAGVTVIQLAGLLSELGCTQAMNLDGGPSTQMAVLKNGELTQLYSGVSSRIGDGLLVTVRTPAEQSTENAHHALWPFFILLAVLILLFAAAGWYFFGVKRRRGRH